MAWSLIPVYLGSFTANFDEKTSAKSVYSLGTLVRTLSAFWWAIWALFEGCTSSPKSTLRAATYITKTLYSRSKAAVVNSFFPINLICLVVRSTSSVVYDLYYKFRVWELMSALFMVRKSIPSITSSLTSANRKLSSKNLSLPSLSNMKKVETTIS